MGRLFVPLGPPYFYMTMAPGPHRGLDWTGKISKDMRMTAMPRIGARWSCVDWGLAEQ